MTKSGEQNCQRVIKRQLSLLRICLQLAQTKTGLLMRFLFTLDFQAAQILESDRRC